ncbi:MAG: nuclear transport factor 2 family protein [Nonlabens sp.]
MKYLFITAAFWITSCNSPIKSPSAATSLELGEKDVQLVEELVQNIFDEVWGAMDTTAVEKYHTNDFLLLEHGEVWDNNRIKDWAVRARASSAGMKRINSFERIKYSIAGDKIWLAYHNYATIKRDTTARKLQWLESVVAIKEEHQWKLELMHSTRVNLN